MGVMAEEEGLIFALLQKGLYVEGVMYRVMIVDDEPIMGEGTSHSIKLGKWDCEVVAVAYDDIEGRTLIEERKPDLVFMDVCIPEVNGSKMIVVVGTQFPNFETNVLTGFHDFEYAKETVRPGVMNYLRKPADMDELEEAIEAMCSNLKKKGITAGAVNMTSSAAEEAFGEKSSFQKSGKECESKSGSFIVRNALKYIEENHDRKLTLSEVAEKTYVSQWHLSKLLNRHTGKSFSDILNHARIEQAKELLNDPSLRIGDIAEQVGFLDLAHFSRVFKRQEGFSANEYRNTIVGRNLVK